MCRPERHAILRALDLLIPAALAAGLLVAGPALAENFTMGNFDPEGSRSIPSELEPTLSRAEVTARGLEVKRLLPTDDPVAAPPLVADGIVYAADINFDTFQGSAYAFNAASGVQLWKTPVGAVVASPLISGSDLYVGTLAGTLYRIDRATGEIEASVTPGIRPGFDAIWSGAIAVGDTIVFAINPNDEFPGPLAPGGLGALLAVDSQTLEEVWRFVPVDNDVDEPPMAGQQYGGAGIWNTQITYSSELGLLFFGTGQNTYSTDGRTPGGDSIFAVDAENGTLAWQTQTQDGDIWNLNIPYLWDGSDTPIDTDVGASPAVFFDGDDAYVAVGSKRGYFYVMDAADGTIVNGEGRDVHGFLRGLEVLSLPGPGLDGGFNLDTGYFRDGEGDVVHFGMVNDYAGRFDPSEPFCYGAGYGLGLPECPSGVAFGHLVLLSGDGSTELGRYSNPNAALYTPLELDGMILAREIVDLTTFGADQLLVLDVSDPTNPVPIEGATIELPNTRSIGAHLSVSGGLIFTGSGAFSDQFGSPSGVLVIGLKDAGGGGEECIADATTACLLDGRFRVTGTMTSQQGDEFTLRVVSFGDSRAETDSSVMLESFIPGGIEYAFKMVDGCSVNDHFWGFLSGTLTDQATEFKVVDTLTGEERTYTNASGQVASGFIDTQYFATCDD